MEPSTRGYSPQQIATGNLEDGKEVVILYIKEFSEQLRRVKSAIGVGYFYTWSYLANSDTYILFVYWDNQEEVAIVFPPSQHTIIEGLKEPKELIITSTPIKMLVDRAVDTGQDFFDLDGPIVYLRDIVLKETSPQELN
jgi:hypothetical protein